MALRPQLVGGLPLEWRGVGPQAIGSEGDEVQDFALAFRYRWPLEPSHGESLLMRAAALGDTAVIGALLDSKVHVGCREPRSVPAFRVHRGLQPCHIAAMFGHASAIALLLEREADANASTAMRGTPLHFAVVAERIAALHPLVQRRADMRPRNIFGQTTLDIAAMHARVDALQALFRYGAPTCCSEDGVNALHCAALMNAGPAVVQVLLNGRVNPRDRCRPRAFSVVWLLTSSPRSSAPSPAQRRTSWRTFGAMTLWSGSWCRQGLKTPAS